MRVCFASVSCRVVFYILIITLLVSVSPVVADDGPGTAIADFLNVQPGARAGSLAGACAALSGGLATFQYNPAAVGLLAGPAATLHHTNWYESTYHEYVAAGTSIGSSTSLAASFGYIHYGAIAGYDAENNPTGEFSPSDAIVTLAIGQQIGDRFSFGLAAKYFQERLDKSSFSGWAFDLGAQYRTGMMSFGAAVLNLGPEISAGDHNYALPQQYRLGLGLRLSPRLVTSADLELDAGGDGTVVQGVEYGLMPGFVVRGGYRHQTEANRGDATENWTIGGGMIVSGAQIDYNYQPGGMLGDIHRFTVSF